MLIDKSISDCQSEKERLNVTQVVSSRDFYYVKTLNLILVLRYFSVLNLDTKEFISQSVSDYHFRLCSLI